MKIECLVCGYVGEPKQIKLQYRGHWIMGLFECRAVCPCCGDTAIEPIVEE